VIRFALPDTLSAAEPPEARGLPRDGVRLLVARAGAPVEHGRFTDLPAALEPGDLVVVNTSDTEPAALDGTRDDGRPVVLHVSGPHPAGGTVVELRTPDGRRVRDARAGEAVHVAGTVVTLDEPVPGAAPGRLWRTHRAGLPAGRPVTYSHLHGPWPLAAHRTVFATPVPGEFASAEMPSAGRPFTRRVLDGLAARGVAVAPLVLHTGLSSPEAGETPLPERYRVPAATWDAVRAAAGRVVAVGTTVTRALEAVAATGELAGWTDLVLSPERPARVVDGLVTGWHEPEASHLLLLEAVAGAELVGRAYAAALDGGYLWHEFGDSCLLLPGRSTARRAA
jgi:S-adenosylmethionine:tRNA ribosyltransferase-isomerase